MQFTIYADLRITRRKLFHVVQNEAGELVFKSRLLGECIAFAEEEEATSIQLTLTVGPNDKDAGTYTLARKAK